MENRKFDQAVKDLLQDHKVDMPKDAFSAFLKEETLYDAKEDFDHAIKEKLETVEAPIVMSSWSSFEKSLAADEEAGMDEVIKEKLSENKVPYEEKTWTVLENRLLEWEALRRHFWTMRLSELCILVLLIFTVWNFNGYSIFNPSDGVTDLDLAVQTVTQSNNTVDSRQGLKGNGDDVPSVASTNTQKKTTQNTVDKIKDNTRESTVKTNRVSGKNRIDLTEVNVSVPSTSNSQKGNLETPLNNILGSAGELESESVSSSSSLNDLGVTSSSSSSSESGVLAKGSEENSDIVKTSSRVTSKSIYPNVLYTAQHFILDIPELLEIPIFENSDFKKAGTAGASRKKIWISLNNQIGISTASTPEDSKNGFKASKGQSLSYGSGLNMGFENGRWTLETGIEYEFKKINPNRNLDISLPMMRGNYNVDFNAMKMHFVNIGLQGRYACYKKHKNEIYGLVGAKLHIATIDNYFIVSPNRGQAGFIDDVRAEDYFGEEQNINYFTLNVGIGYQRYLSPRLVLFAQPSFEYYFQNEGVANNKDKIQTGRLDFGVRVKI